jgi:hypothetical protein
MYATVPTVKVIFTCLDLVGADWFYLTYLSGKESWFTVEKPYRCRETCG